MTTQPATRGVPDPSGHAPVLLQQVADLLAAQPGQTMADLTAGRGGHAAMLAQRVAPGGRLLLVDRDLTNLAYAHQRVEATPGVHAAPGGHATPGVQVSTFHGNFAALPSILGNLGWQADGLLADLGFASTQVDDPARGLSFLHPGPLDMRLDPTQGETAAQLVARLPEAELADLIFHWGEDPFARRIARAIVEARQRAPIQTTQDLAQVVRQAYGARARQSRLNPATRTFMALRIRVNDELGSLEGLLEAVSQAARSVAAGRISWLRPGARVAIISFHSLEDRLVKHTFADLERAGAGERLTRKPVEADAPEHAANPRARSAKLRVFHVCESPAAV